MTLNELLTVVAVATVAALLASVWGYDRRRRRRDGSVLSGVVGTFDEAFHPEAARAAEIREVQRELPVEAPSPGDPPTTGGRAISLSAAGRPGAHEGSGGSGAGWIDRP